MPVEGRTMAPPASVKTTRPKLFRRASLTSWGKDNLRMTRAAADTNIRELMLAVQQQKFEDREKAAQRKASYTESCTGDASIQQRDDRRARLLSRSCARRVFLNAWEREGRAKWSSNQAAICRYERRLLSYELAVKARASARQRMSRTWHANDAAGGIRWLEKNLDRLGLDVGGDSGGNLSIAAGDILFSDKDTQAMFRSKLLHTVLDQKFVPGSNAEAMAELHFRGNAGRHARREREHRRLKTEVDRRHAKAETDAQRAANEHLESMLVAGREKRLAAAAHWERRQVREQQAMQDTKSSEKMKAAKQDAFEKAFNRFSICAREEYAARKAKREAVVQVLKTKQQLHRDNKQQRTQLLCMDSALKLVDLAVVASETRADRGGGPLPPTLWMALKLRFCSPIPFFEEKIVPESATEGRNPALEANALLQRRNLDRCDGQWRPQGLVRAAFEQEITPLNAALSVARYLTEAAGTGPRESPATYCSDRIADNSDKTEVWNLSVKLVLLGGTTSLHSELRRWTGLYCCDLETALECAMDLGAKMAAVDTKNTGGKKKRKSSAVAESLELATEEAGTRHQTVVAHMSFDLQAREEDVATFKEAAASYYALRTHPKKAAVPVPLATLTDVLVKHLACHSAPGRRGWILIGYPRSPLEAKMLENSLTGYMDDDVARELGVGGKGSASDAKKKKMSVVPGKTIAPPPPPTSGLDVVLHISTAPSKKASQGRSAEFEAKEEIGSEVMNGSLDDVDTENDQNILKNSAEHYTAGTGATEAAERFSAKHPAGTETNEQKEEDRFPPETRALVEWWSTFKDGQLACEVPHEVSNERLLETLFLLVILAQKRKEDHIGWMEANKHSEAILAEGDNVGDAGCDVVSGSGPISTNTSTLGDQSLSSSVHRVSPLASSLMSSLKEMRDGRRGRMSHAMRIRVESLTGERHLDLEGVRAAIKLEAQSNGPAVKKDLVGTKVALCATEALQKLEGECAASSVVDWMAAADYSFACGLRAPEKRWTVACLRLEGDIADFIARRDETAAVDARARATSRTTTTIHSYGVSSERSHIDAPPTESDSVWESIEAFEQEAGDIVDERHTTVEGVCHMMDAEAQELVSAWARGVSVAAADLCAAERRSHLEVVRTLCSLHTLFGLEVEPGAADLQTTRMAARFVADGLASELSNAAASSPHLLGKDGGLDLNEEVRLACEQATATTNNPICDVADGGIAGKRKGNRGEETTSMGDVASVGEVHVEECDVKVGSRLGRRCDRVEGDTVPFIKTGIETHDCGVEQGAARHKPIDGEEDALATAVWKTRYSYICRVWGVVVRLAKAVKRSELLTSSTVSRMKFMKRRRVQLEHEAVGVAAAAVKRALTDCDDDAIRDILEQGIPLWVEDDETFAADPGVALSWGMNTLGLSHVASLAISLRQAFGAVTSTSGSSGDACTMVPATPELANVVKAWAEKLTVRAQRGPREEIPSVWIKVDNVDGYIRALCRAVGSTGFTKTFQWRKLVHCLLLGHICALPTLAELRAMRLSFEHKQISPDMSSQSNGFLQMSGSAVIPGGTRVSASEPEPTLSLIIAESQFVSDTLVWFEEALMIGTGEDRVEDGRRGCGDSSGVSSTIKAIYSKAWADDEGRLDALDLLLTLCSVPVEREDSVFGVGAEDADRGDGGIPFSLGLFQAFSLLADSRSASTAKAQTSRGQRVAATYSTTPVTSYIAPKNTSADPLGLPEPDGNPHVTLPQLCAILRHGGIPAKDVPGIFEIAWNMDETERQRKWSQVSTAPSDRPDNVATNQNGEYMPDVAGLGLVRQEVAAITRDNRNDDSQGSRDGQDILTLEGGRANDAATAENYSVTVPDGEVATTQRTEESQSGEGVEAPAAKGDEALVVAREETEDQESGKPGLPTTDVNAASGRITAEFDPRRVSFSAVSANSAVRSWVRSGAYTLPPFGVTSGSSIFPTSRDIAN